MMIGFKNPASLLLVTFLALAGTAHAAAPFELDLKELDRQGEPAPAAKSAEKKPAKAKKPAAHHPKAVHREEGAGGEYTRYTVKPGDHIFKILMSRFGMSNEAAERLIPEIARINNLSNIRSLPVGQTLLIPRKSRRVHKAASCPPQVKPQVAAKQDRAAQVPEPAAQPEAQGRIAQPVPELRQNAPQAEAPRAPEPAAPETAPPASETPLPLPPAASTAPTAPASAAPAPTAAATWVCSVAGADPAGTVDSILNALSIPWSKNRIVNSEPGAANTFSIRVDRYFEFRGGKYIVSIGNIDPYTYTLIRLLETAGYKTLSLLQGEDVKETAEQLMKLVGMTPDFGRFLVAGKGRNGFLVPQEDAGGRQVLITDEPADPNGKWMMKPGCR